MMMMMMTMMHHLLIFRWYALCLPICFVPFRSDRWRVQTILVKTEKSVCSNVPRGNHASSTIYILYETAGYSSKSKIICRIGTCYPMLCNTSCVGMLHWSKYRTRPLTLEDEMLKYSHVSYLSYFIISSPPALGYPGDRQYGKYDIVVRVRPWRWQSGFVISKSLFCYYHQVLQDFNCLHDLDSDYFVTQFTTTVVPDVLAYARQPGVHANIDRVGQTVSASSTPGIYNCFIM